MSAASLASYLIGKLKSDEATAGGMSGRGRGSPTPRLTTVWRPKSIPYDIPDTNNSCYRNEGSLLKLLRTKSMPLLGVESSTSPRRLVASPPIRSPARSESLSPVRRQMSSGANNRKMSSGHVSDASESTAASLATPPPTPRSPSPTRPRLRSASDGHLWQRRKKQLRRTTDKATVMLPSVKNLREKFDEKSASPPREGTGQVDSDKKGSETGEGRGSRRASRHYSFVRSEVRSPERHKPPKPAVTPANIMKLLGKFETSPQNEEEAREALPKNDTQELRSSEASLRISTSEVTRDEAYRRAHMANRQRSKIHRRSKSEPDWSSVLRHHAQTSPPSVKKLKILFERESQTVVASDADVDAAPEAASPVERQKETTPKPSLVRLTREKHAEVTATEISTVETQHLSVEEAPRLRQRVKTPPMVEVEHVLAAGTPSVRNLRQRFEEGASAQSLMKTAEEVPKPRRAIVHRLKTPFEEPQRQKSRSVSPDKTNRHTLTTFTTGSVRNLLRQFEERSPEEIQQEAEGSQVHEPRSRRTPTTDKDTFETEVDSNQRRHSRTSSSDSSSDEEWREEEGRRRRKEMERERKMKEEEITKERQRIEQEQITRMLEESKKIEEKIRNEMEKERKENERKEERKAKEKEEEERKAADALRKEKEKIEEEMKIKERAEQEKLAEEDEKRKKEILEQKKQERKAKEKEEEERKAADTLRKEKEKLEEQRKIQEREEQEKLAEENEKRKREILEQKKQEEEKAELEMRKREEQKRKDMEKEEEEKKRAILEQQKLKKEKEELEMRKKEEENRRKNIEREEEEKKKREILEQQKNEKEKELEMRKKEEQERKKREREEERKEEERKKYEKEMQEKAEKERREREKLCREEAQDEKRKSEKEEAERISKEELEEERRKEKSNSKEEFTRRISNEMSQAASRDDDSDKSEVSSDCKVPEMIDRFSHPRQRGDSPPPDTTIQPQPGASSELRVERLIDQFTNIRDVDFEAEARRGDDPFMLGLDGHEDENGEGRRHSDVAALVNKFRKLNERRRSSSSSGSESESEKPREKPVKEEAPIPTIQARGSGPGKVRTLREDEMRFFECAGGGGGGGTEPFLRTQSLRAKKTEPSPFTQPRYGSLRGSKSRVAVLSTSSNPTTALPRNCRRLNNDELQFFTGEVTNIYRNRTTKPRGRAGKMGGRDGRPPKVPQKNALPNSDEFFRIAGRDEPEGEPNGRPAPSEDDSDLEPSVLRSGDDVITDSESDIYEMDINLKSDADTEDYSDTEHHSDLDRTLSLFVHSIQGELLHPVATGGGSESESRCYVVFSPGNYLSSSEDEETLQFTFPSPTLKENVSTPTFRENGLSLAMQEEEEALHDAPEKAEGLRPSTGNKQAGEAHDKHTDGEDHNSQPQMSADSEEEGAKSSPIVDATKHSELTTKENGAGIDLLGETTAHFLPLEELKGLVPTERETGQTGETESRKKGRHLTSEERNSGNEEEEKVEEVNIKRVNLLEDWGEDNAPDSSLLHEQEHAIAALVDELDRLDPLPPTTTPPPATTRRQENPYRIMTDDDSSSDTSSEDGEGYTGLNYDDLKSIEEQIIPSASIQGLLAYSEDPLGIPLGNDVSLSTPKELADTKTPSKDSITPLRATDDLFIAASPSETKEPVLTNSFNNTLKEEEREDTEIKENHTSLHSQYPERQEECKELRDSTVPEEETEQHGLTPSPPQESEDIMTGREFIKFCIFSIWFSLIIYFFSDILQYE